MDRNERILSNIGGRLAPMKSIQFTTFSLTHTRATSMEVITLHKSISLSLHMLACLNTSMGKKDRQPTEVHEPSTGN